MERDIVVLYSDTMDVQEWMRSHREGMAPGLVPYGLNRLAETGSVVRYEQGKGAGRNPMPYAGLLAQRGLRRPPTRSASEAAVAWDERTAVPLLTRFGDSGRRLGAGVIWATDDLSGRSWAPRLRMVKEVLRQMDVVWCLSRAQVPVLQSWLGGPAHRVQFLPFGIDVELFAQQEWRDEPLVLSVGNDRHRDIPTLYAALAEVHRARPDVRMVVQTRSELKPPEGVETVWSMTVPELRALYAQASVVAVASSDNLHVSGMTVCLEAMATGRPAVLSGTPGAHDYVLDGVTGFLARPGDPGSHASALLRLLDDPARARSLGDSGADHVRAHHSESTMCSALAGMLFAEPLGRSLG